MIKRKAKNDLVYFAGIDVPEHIKHTINLFQRNRMGKFDDSMEWFGQYEFHLTLAYFGHVTQEQRDLLISISDTIKLPNFKVEISGLGFFPPGKNPKILWVGIGNGREMINAFGQKVRETLHKKSGIVPQDKFFPHITIGKVKPKDDHSELFEFVRNNWNYPFGMFKVESFHLYRIVNGGYVHNHEVKLKNNYKYF